MAFLSALPASRAWAAGGSGWRLPSAPKREPCPAETEVPRGFAACTAEELAWLYVAPEAQHKGIGRALIVHCVEQFPEIESIEVLCGNEPARRLYEQMGFAVEEILSGQMPGNEDFSVEVYCLRKK